MGNWFKDLMNSKKKYNLYDKEGCAATGKITCDRGDCKCHECNYAEQFLKTGKKVDTYNNDYKNLYRGKDLYGLLDECEYRLKYSHKLLNDIKNEITGSDKERIKYFLKNNNINPNIHLSKREKEKIREEHLRLYNTPKPKYRYNGDETIDTDLTTYVKILWNDYTVTTVKCQFGDNFNYGYGVLLATAKKFVKKLNLKDLESIVNYNKARMIEILELLVYNTAGSKCLNDIRKEANREFNFNKDSKQIITLDDLIKKLNEKNIYRI